ncbi:MAG: hypothetical protein P4L69_01200 [Desulfosporosinus sp.]|nr:hypothetical protein [Desulfosporosinus sp.]
MKDNPNKIWVVASPKRARYPEYSQYNSVTEALSDFDDWTLETASIESCEVLYRGITLMQSSKGNVSGAACEQYNQDCTIRSKLPSSLEILNCVECVKKMIVDYVE